MFYNLGDFNEWDEGIMRRSYVADFETTTDENDCRVWAMAVCDVYDVDNVVYGNTIEDFFAWCVNNKPCNVYFHNLAFDGAFIMDWLLNHEWTWVKDRKDVRDRTFTTLISDMNKVYCIEVFYSRAFSVKIMDSLKIIPQSVARIAKTFGLEEGKGGIDYEAYREPGHELTDEEKEYIRKDVQIVAHAMRVFLDEGLTKMTAGSNALYGYKELYGGAKRFRRRFPYIEEKEDALIRSAYRGGFTYVNPKYAGKKLGAGIVFDVNSLYPSVMAACDGQVLPYGEPLMFEGKPTPNEGYPLWVAVVTCCFKVKPDHIPCIQLKNSVMYDQREYLEDSKGEVTFTVTNVDWELMQQQYEVTRVRWHGGYLFQGMTVLFKRYVDKWVEVKNNATLEGNMGMREQAKLMLNSLYGKFGTRPEVCSRQPVLEGGVLRYRDLEPEHKDPVYIPVAVFVTAYARYKTITSAQAVYDRFVYADTDSLHLIGTEIPDNLDVDQVRLGAWKHESTFWQAKFIRPKCYIEYIEGSDTPNVKCAGMPYNVHDQVNIDNLKIGAVYHGKLYQKHVPGGIVLVPGDMKIREQ